MRGGKENNRNSPRFPVHIEVHFCCVDNTTDTATNINNVPKEVDQIGCLLTASPYGVFMKTPCTLNTDDLVELVLPLPYYPLNVLGKVAWTCTSDPIGVGIEFQSLNDTEREKILDCINTGFWLGADISKKVEPDMFSSETIDYISDFE